MIPAKKLSFYLWEKYGLSEKDSQEVARNIIKKRHVQRIWEVKFIDGNPVNIPLRIKR